MAAIHGGKFRPVKAAPPLARDAEPGLGVVAPTDELEIWEAIGPIKTEH
jgi:hypothetical protein